MSVLGDRIIMTVIAGTLVAGVVGWVVGGLVGEIGGWQMRVALPVVLAVIFLASLVVIWEGLDTMD